MFLREIDQLKVCRFCKGTNTQRMAMSISAFDKEDKMVFLGWCRDCYDEYGYQIGVDTVHDKKERI